MRRRPLILVLTLALSPAVPVTASQAVVVKDAGRVAGVSIIPAARGSVVPAGVTVQTSSGGCTDPWLAQDFWFDGQTGRLPDGALCYHGGSVLHRNETFALTWDPLGAFPAATRTYLEQFLTDVARASGSRTSPFALTQQYRDQGGSAGNVSQFGGGCLDGGAAAGSTCEYGVPTQAGHDFPASDCPVSGDSFTSPSTVTPNTVCLTDASLQGELATMITETGILTRTQTGYAPLLALLLAPGVTTCLDSSGSLCAANSGIPSPPPARVTVGGSGGSLPVGTYQIEITYVTASGESAPSAPVTAQVTSSGAAITIEAPPAAAGATGWRVYVSGGAGLSGSAFQLQGSTDTLGTNVTLTSVGSGARPPSPTTFCSYHSQVNVGGTEVAYVVQPWTVGTGCDDPDAPALPADPTAAQLALAAGRRLASPLSQGQIAAIVNPAFDGWWAQRGAEIYDNGGCGPQGYGSDTVELAGDTYYLQREFNNGGAIDPTAATYYGCAPQVQLQAAFAVPDSVGVGDQVQFDGSGSTSTLLVGSAGYQWSFGDGASAAGPKPVHTYSKAGTYTVTLTVTDRGGYTDSLSQTIDVVGSATQPSPVGPSPTPAPPTSVTKTRRGFTVHILLMPQGLRTVLTHGLRARVTSSERAAGIATVSISRAAARWAHIRAGRGRTVVIGIGTISRLKAGTVSLRLRFSRAVGDELSRLGHVTLTVRLALVAADGSHLAIDVAGRY